MIFHVHIDASNFAIGCVLVQLGKHNLDYPISFASCQLNEAEVNYTTMKREGLAIVYVVRKLYHSLLASQFIFIVDHQAVLYILNKPCTTSHIPRWMWLLLEFDFMVIVCKGFKHALADHLYRVLNGELATKVEDDLPNAPHFQLDLIPEWATEVSHFLAHGFLEDMPINKE